MVEEGARLTVRSVAAAVVLPARGESPPSRQLVRAEVAGVLDMNANAVKANLSLARKAVRRRLPGVFPDPAPAGDDLP